MQRSESSRGADGRDWRRVRDRGCKVCPSIGSARHNPLLHGRCAPLDAGAGSSSRKPLLTTDGPRGRRPGAGARVPAGLPRRSRGQGRPRSCSRAGPGSASRRSGWRASSRRARRGCASSRRGRPRPSAGSRTSASATCSRTCSTTCSRCCRRRGGARSRSRSCSRSAARTRSIRARSGSRRASALEALAEQRRCSLAIDDVQWLDASSAGALAFALRRLGATACCFCSPGGARRARSRRRSSRRSAPTRPAARGRAAQRRALHRLLRDRLGRPFARQTLLRIHERSGGNPFFALELARVLDADRPVAAARRFPDARGARCARGLRPPRADPRRARTRLGARDGLGVAARAGRRRARTRSSRRSPPTCSSSTTGRSGSPTRCSRRFSTDLGAERRPSTRGSRRSSTTRSCARATSRCRGAPDADVAASSTTPRGWPPSAARRPSPPSSPSRRSG